MNLGIWGDGSLSFFLKERNDDDLFEMRCELENFGFCQRFTLTEGEILAEIVECFHGWRTKVGEKSFL